jgi:membrane associated rhomboid family serine protease
MLSPFEIVHNKQIYRLITNGFLHGNWGHLIINMLVFYSFAVVTINTFSSIWGNFGIFLFILLYLSAIIISSLYSTFKHKNNLSYAAIGASGATSAITFTFILFYPWEKILFFGVLPCPAIIFGGLFLVYSYIMGKRGKDNVGHDAHFWGAIYGFIFPLLFKPSLIKFFISRIIDF